MKPNALIRLLVLAALLAGPAAARQGPVGNRCLGARPSPDLGSRRHRRSVIHGRLGLRARCRGSRDRAPSGSRARLITGNGWRKVDLVGFSRGVLVSYTYLNDETRLPRRLRNVDHYVAMDAPFKEADAEARALACSRIDAVQAQIDSGDVAFDNRAVARVGRLARSAPDAPSPFFPGLTNRQAALVFLTLPPGGVGTFHAFSGFFENGLPVGLRYSAEGAAFGLLAEVSAYQPRAGLRDALIVACDDGRSRLDDRLDAITVPVL